MAGGHGDFHPVKIDPAIERWSQMRENVYKTFKFTPKRAGQVFVWGAVVPAAFGLAAYYSDTTSDWAGKKRGQSLLTKAPAAEASAEASE